jgi:hypothetical protein
MFFQLAIAPLVLSGAESRVQNISGPFCYIRIAILYFRYAAYTQAAVGNVGILAEDIRLHKPDKMHPDL